MKKFGQAASDRPSSTSANMENRYSELVFYVEKILELTPSLFSMPATCRHCCSKQRKAEMNCLVLVSSTIHGTFFLFAHGLAFSFPPDHFCVIQHLIIFLFSIQAAGLAGWAGRSSLVLQARTKLRIILLLLQMAR